MKTNRSVMQWILQAAHGMRLTVGRLDSFNRHCFAGWEETMLKLEAQLPHFGPDGKSWKVTVDTAETGSGSMASFSVVVDNTDEYRVRYEVEPLFHSDFRLVEVSGPSAVVIHDIIDQLTTALRQKAVL